MSQTINNKSLDLTIKEGTTNQIENEERQWIAIEDPNIAISILGSYADEQKRLILKSVVYESHTVSELLKICKIPLVSFYRKANSLIQEGLIVKNPVVMKYHGLKYHGRGIKYKAVFDNLRIDIDGHGIIVKGKLNKNF